MNSSAPYVIETEGTALDALESADATREPGEERSVHGPNGPWGAIVRRSLLLIVVIVMYGNAALAVLVLTILFLVQDDGKGGSCASSSGTAVWTYVIVRLVINYCFLSPTSFAMLNSDRESSILTRRISANFNIYISIAILLYGCIVLFNAEVCNQYEATGLYQMYVWIWAIDLVWFVSITTLYLYHHREYPIAESIFCLCCSTDASQEILRSNMTGTPIRSREDIEAAAARTASREQASTLVCPQCGKTNFSSQRNYDTHLEYVHGIKPGKANPEVCPPAPPSESEESGQGVSESEPPTKNSSAQSYGS